MADEIISELWDIKDAIGREYGYDVDALVAHLRTAQSRSGQAAVDLQSLKVKAEQDASADAALPSR